MRTCENKSKSVAVELGSIWELNHGYPPTPSPSMPRRREGSECTGGMCGAGAAAGDVTAQGRVEEEGENECLVRGEEANE